MIERMQADIENLHTAENYSTGEKSNQNFATDTWLIDTEEDLIAKKTLATIVHPEAEPMSILTDL